MKSFVMLLKRESWEHPALWMVPAVVAGLVILAMLYGLAKVWGLGEEARKVGVEISKLAMFAPEERRMFLSGALVAGVAPFGFFLLGLMFFYSLDSLYAERRDRSVLFWKSMPVSDVQTVLSKLVMATVGAPLFTLAVIAVFHVVTMLLGTMVAIITGTDGWYMGLDPLAFLSAWGRLAWLALATSIVVLPFIGWVLLASAWARKAPFLWAIVPPVAIITMENISYDRSYLWNWILTRFLEAGPLVIESAVRGVRVTMEDGGTLQVGGVPSVKFDLLWSGLMWQGVIIAAIFVVGAIWLRRYRGEAE